MNTNEQLKPCPFCGGKAYLYANDGVCVKCLNCAASSMISADTVYVTENNKCAVDRVIEAWNRRANE